MSKGLNMQIKNSPNKIIKNGGILASVGLVAIAAMGIAPIDRRELVVEAAPGTVTPATTSIEVTTGRGVASVDLSVTSTAGTFAKSADDKKANFKVTTNNATGYTLTIKASDDNGQLANGEETLSSIASTIDEATFEKGSAYNGQWGFVPSKYNSSDNTNFLKSPTTEGTTLNVTSGASTNDEYTIGLGARVDYSKANGTYTKTFVITATANKVAYNISYDKGSTSESVTGLPSAQISSGTDAESITLSSDKPTRTGYDFNGWCLGTISTTNKVDSCTGTGAKTFAAGGSFGLDWTTSNTVTLHAMWTPKKYSLKITFAGGGVSSVKVCATSGDCTGTNLLGTVSTSGNSVSGLSYGTAYYLYPAFASGNELSGWAKTDSATGAANPTYTIGLGDGAVTVTSKSSCSSSVSGTMQAFNPCSDMTATSGSLTDSRDNQTYTVAKIGNLWWMTRNLAIGCAGTGTNYSATISSKSLTSADSNVSSNFSTPTALLSKASSSTRDADYSAGRMQCSSEYGAWYNYYAATAGTISGSSNTTEASKDICPAGWRLPTNSEFGTIGTSSGSTTNVSAFSPVYSGYYVDGSLYYTGSYGYWWSSTAGNAAGRYYLDYGSGKLYSGDFYGRYNGSSVRCVRSS